MIPPETSNSRWGSAVFMSNDLSTTRTRLLVLLPLLPPQAASTRNATSAKAVAEDRFAIIFLPPMNRAQGRLTGRAVELAIVCREVGERPVRSEATTSVYDLRVTVERIEGRPVCGLAVGDYFEVTESSRIRIPEGRHFCLYALQSVLPFIAAKQRRLPAEDWLEQDSHIACPDPDERVVMRIERIGERALVTEELT